MDGNVGYVGGRAGLEEGPQEGIVGEESHQEHSPVPSFPSVE